MKNLEEIKQLLHDSASEEVLSATADYLEQPADDATMAEVYYLRGNAYRQKGNWKKAMNCYLQSAELQPDGPAAESYKNAEEVLAYYHKDYYNP